jgi:pimeloyl-[acyl-carrier protein] methyl ester esterase
VLHIDVQGRGPALVLLHGWGLHGGVFAPLRAQLREHFTLYTVDLPGHGHSSHAPVPPNLTGWAQAVLDEVPNALWLGWSLGGLVALQAALQRPQAVSGLVMLASSPRFCQATGWPGVDAGVLAGFAEKLQTHYASTVDGFLALDLINLPAGQQAARALHADLLAVGQPTAQAIATGAHLLQHTDLRAPLASLSVPSLWLAGQRDRLVPAAATLAACTIAPAARQLTVPGTGHAPFLGDTAAVTQALLDFQRSLA